MGTDSTEQALPLAIYRWVLKLPKGMTHACPFLQKAKNTAARMAY